jgi:hypothetical protein
VRRAALLLLLAATARGDVVVLRDLSILEGDVAPSGTALAVAGRSVPLAQVLLWEDASGVARHAPSFTKLLRAYGALADRETLRRCREAFPAAVAAGDAASALALLQRAEDAGLEAKEAEAWAAKAASLPAAAASSFAPPPDSALADLLVDRARKHRAAGDEERALDLLRAALRRDAQHADANALLAELAPESWPLGDARNWLEWRVEVLRQRPRVLTRRHIDMERARTLWRKDLFGVETSRIVLITSLREPEIVGKCLRLSGLTYEALNALFATDAPRRDEPDPLVIYLYESLEEYVAKSKEGVGGGGGFPLRLTLGHYNPADNVSRFYWFDRPDAERSVTTTFVHELTHHWIDRANPRFHFREMNRSGATPGFWIVEGFARFVEESVFDPASGRWSHFDPHSGVLDTVDTLAKKNALMPWEKLYPLTQDEFQTLGKEFHIPCRRRWSIGQVGFSETNLFYQQAGATCHFLYWGEEGKYRQPLLDYVTAYYTGKAEATSVKNAFGLEPAELGKKVEAYAAAVAGGWRPKHR